MRISLALLILAVGTAGCAGSKPRRVRAEGWGDISQGVGQARRQALAEAQKKAVEQLHGVGIAARTRVEKGVAVRQRITADAQGALGRYEVLEEERVGSALKIVISAEPSTGAASLPPLPPPEETRVALRAAPGSEAWLASASRALGEALRESGFSIVEGRSEAQFIASLDVRLAHVKDPRLGSLSAYEAHVLVRLSEPLRDEIVAEPSARASYADWDREGAAEGAVERAARAAGERAAGALSSLLWKR